MGALHLLANCRSTQHWHAQAANGDHRWHSMDCFDEHDPNGPNVCVMAACARCAARQLSKTKPVGGAETWSATAGPMVPSSSSRASAALKSSAADVSWR